MLDTFHSKRKSTKPLLLKIDILVEPDDGGFHAFAPALQGLHVSGDTEEEAVKNAAEAIGVYLDSLKRHGDPLPVGPHLSIEEEKTQTPARASRKSVLVECPSMQMCGAS